MTDFFVYDVFSQEAFGGNQLAVIPDATSVPEADLQRIAREFNFPESAFVFPPEQDGHLAKVRIFTPLKEIDFAGHPLIGTAVSLADMGKAGDMVLGLRVGPIACTAEKGRAQFTTEVPLKIMARPHPALVARTLGLTEKDVVTKTHVPTMATLGLPFTITELASREALEQCLVDISLMRDGAEQYPASLDFAQFAYFREGDTIHARMFAPLDNIPEDPATGSACATLGALLQQILDEDQTLTIRQGEDMGRLSIIELKTNGPAITIAGAAKRVMQGQLVY